MSSPPDTLEDALEELKKKEVLLKRYLGERLVVGVEFEKKRETYEAQDPDEVSEFIKSHSPFNYDYSSTDFFMLGKYRLKELVNQHGAMLFYHIDPKKKTKTVFKPALLASFLEICYSVITIRPETFVKHDKGDMWYYKEDLGCYVSNAETYFNTFIRRIWDDDFKDSFTVQTYPALMYETYIERDEFTLDKKFIPLENGLLELYKDEEDLWTYRLIENNPDLYVTERIPIIHDPDAKAPLFLKFLDELLPQQRKEQKWIQQYAGYSLYRDWPFDKVVLMLGDGDNGKSTLLEILRELIGIRNTTTIGIYELCNEPYQTAELYKKLANIDADTSTKDLKKTSKFKRATGGDYIQARRIYKAPFNFPPYCKHWLSANIIPYCYDDTEAFFRRWIPIQFWQKFRAEDEDTDPNIKEKILAELPGILNWALEGLMEILNNERFTDVPTSEQVRIFWNQLSNPIYAFLYSGAVIIDSLAHYDKQKFFEDYTNYCIEHRLPRWTKDKVGKRITDKFDFIHNTRPTNPDGQRPPAWGGICQNPNYKEDKEHRHELQKAILIIVGSLQPDETMTTKELEAELKILLQNPEMKFKDLFGISGILDFLDLKMVVLRSGSDRKTLNKGPNWVYSERLLEEIKK